MDVSEHGGYIPPTPKSSILLGCFPILTIHFGVFPPIFGNTHIYMYTWTFQFGCQMVQKKGVNLQFFLGFHWHPLEDAGIDD